MCFVFDGYYLMIKEFCLDFSDFFNWLLEFGSGVVLFFVMLILMVYYQWVFGGEVNSLVYQFLLLFLLKYQVIFVIQYVQIMYYECECNVFWIIVSLYVMLMVKCGNYFVFFLLYGYLLQIKIVFEVVYFDVVIIV